MRNSRRFWLFVIALAAVIAIAAACGSNSSSTSTRSTNTGGNATMPGMNGSPMAGIDMDLMFMDSMTPHHQSAIDMAKLAQEQGEHPEIKQLAGAIIAAQQKEIGQMQQWRQAWFGNAPASGGMPGMDTMAGMHMTDADMQQMRDAQPFDKAFLTMMIPHHQSAIVMAQAILKTTQRPEIKQLANDVITSQQQEIDQMQAWLKSWYGQ